MAADATSTAPEQQMLDMRFAGESVSDALARLYQSPVAAIQEIVANAVAACKAARELHGADAYIRIHACGRNLSIEDRDSVGMEWAVFRDVYARAGSSLKRGSNGETTPGMFGCGSLSYVLVSDIMFLASHSRETGEKYEVMACDGRGFQTGLPEPDMDWYGTRVRLTIRKGASLAAMFGRIAEIADACGVRIVVDMDGADPECVASPAWQEKACDAEEAEKAAANRTEESPPGTDAHMGGGVSGRYVFEASGFSDAVRRADEDRVCADGTGGTDIVCIRAESDDIEVAAFNQCNRYANEDVVYSRLTHRTWLAGMPINQPYESMRAGSPYVESRLSRTHGWTVLLHAKNERRYMPTPDRERFTDEAFERLISDADGLLLERLQRIRPKTLAEYLSNPDNRALEPYATRRTEPRHGSYRRRKKLNEPIYRSKEGGIDKRLLKMARAAGPVSIAAKDAGTSLWRLLYGGRTAADGPIDAPLLVVSERPNARLRSAILEHAGASGRENVVVFSPHPRNTLGVDDYVELGCESAAAYAERNGLCKRPAARARKKAAPGGTNVRRRIGSRPRPFPTKREYVVHVGDRGASGRRGTIVPVIKTKRLSTRHAPPHRMSVVRCNDNDSLTAMQGVLASLECDTVCATREQSDVRGAVEFDDYADAAGEASYDTTMGRASGRSLAGCGRRVVLVVYDVPPQRAAGLASLVKASKRCNTDDAVYVFGRAGALAGCAAFLWRVNTKFGVWMLPHYKAGGDGGECILAGKTYLANVVEQKRSPAEAAAGWIQSAIDGTSPQNGCDARSGAMEMLHSHLVGEGILRDAGVEYDGDASRTEVDG